MSTGYNLGRDKNFPVATMFEVGRNTVSIAIYFSFKKKFRNRKNRVTTSYFSEFCHDRTFNVAT